MVTALFAYVNHGRWVCDCPQCNSAEIVTPGQKEFRCGQILPPRFPGDTPKQIGCLHQAPLQFPRNWRAIEQLLEGRPEINRNWFPGETVDLLRSENIEHGIEVIA